MLRDVFYYGEKPNAHPREQFAKNLADARQKCTTEHFWIINEFCDYRNFDWDFDFEFLPDEDVWAEDHNNVWPSQHQKDSGTWLCAKEHSDTIIYRNDVSIITRKNEKQSDFWVELDLIDHSKFDFSWHPDPTDPPYIYKWGCKFFPAVLKHVLEYRVPGATQEKYMTTTVELLPQTDYWVEHQAIDKHKFDMSWRPNPLDPPFIYIWGNKYIDGKLKPTLEYRSPEATSKKYMAEQLAVLPEWDRWVEVQSIDKTSFDFSWRPDPREPDLIYVFGNEHYDAIKMPTVEYHCEGAMERKYMDTQVAKLAPNPKLYEHLEDSQLSDYSWLPDPDSPPYIYVWGNQWNAPEDKISVQIAVPGATEYKYMSARANRKPCLDNWVVPDDVDTTGFDFSWEPNPAAPPYIYEFATQWQKTGGPQYVVPGATEKQYVDFQKVKKLPSSLANWDVPENIDSTGFDFSWHPDDTSPPYIYVFATQWAFSGGPVYTVEGATEIKYVDDQVAIAKTDMTNWAYNPAEIDTESFDFSWHPYVEDQPYIYEFGTQWQKTGGPKYITPGADSSSPIKYIDTRILKSKRLPNPSDTNWKIVNDYKIKDFDFSWHPDNTDEPYIYVFGNNLYPAEEMPTVEYHVPGAKQVKFVNDIIATLDQDLTNWEIPKDVDVTDFDFSWKPNPTGPTYVYEFGTQHQKTGGPRYIVPGATEKQYVDFQKVTKLPSMEGWTVPENIDTSGFDFSWHPDDTSPPYIYVFATQWAFSGGPVYTVSGATETKYVDDQVAIAKTDMTNWVYDPALIDTESFDFSWHPYVEDQPYIYEFGTQWQKTGGPKYITPGADSSSPIKYIDTRILKATRLPNALNGNWVTNYKIKDFDYSWHPDETEEPYIYVFGSNLYPAEECSTVEYRVKGATAVKFISDIIATLDVDMTNWDVPKDIDTSDFDFSWIPNPNDPPYIYEFGTQWQKTGGPRYLVPGATETKYLDFQKVVHHANANDWIIPENIDITEFDFSWHPDATDPPYVYQFGTQWALSGGPRYSVEGATEIKYMDEQTAKALPDKTNWVWDEVLIDVEKFDFSWHPYVEDQPYIYQFGTQWQKTGGPKYVTPGANSSSPIKYVDTRIIKATRLPNKEDVCWNIKHPISDFDWSWHPDETEEPYIYVFGNTQHPAQEMSTVEYQVTGASKFKYVTDIVATLGEDRTNWVITQPINETSFDFSWVPNPKDPAYIYRWGNKYISNKYKATVEYVVPGATDIKYMTDDVEVLPEMDRWEIPNNIDTSDFDFSWRPDPLEPDLIWEFATQWQKSGGPRYVVPGATEVKYIDTQTARRLPDQQNWIIPKHVDITEFDFSWHPDITAPPYIYQFGTQWALSGGPSYVVEGATEVKYMDDLTAKAIPNRDNWEFDERLYDVEKFDFSWHPYVEDQPYIYQFGTQWQKTGGPRYKTPGAKASLPVKYVDPRIIKAMRLPNKNDSRFEILHSIDDFDYSWHPDETEEPYIYVFGNNFYSAEEMPTVYYRVEDATQLKYVTGVVATLAANKSNWKINIPIDESKWDFSWVPNPNDPPYIYVWGNQWNPAEIEPTIEYTVNGATEYKYMHNAVAMVSPDKSRFNILHPVTDSGFDFSWRPNPKDPAYNYVFGNNQYPAEIMPTIEFSVPGATQVKYVSEVVAKLAPTKTNWEIPENIDESSFDFSWVPNPTDPAYIYEFATVWNDRGGPKYIVPDATEFKYIEDIKAKTLPNRKNWEIPEGVDVSKFDFSWVPHPLAPPYGYQFGTLTNTSDGPRYATPNNNGEVVYLERVEAEGPLVGEYYIETTLEDLVKNHPDEVFWAKRKNIDYTEFNFSWRPDSLKDLDYVQVFGSSDSEVTQTYFVNAVNYLAGKTQLKFIETVELTETSLAQIFVKPDMFYVDRSNPESAARFEALKAKFGTKIQKTRYLNSWVDTVNRCINRSTTEVLWILNSELDYSNFDFDYYPNPWQMKMVHVFGTQWNHWGTTFMVNRESFPEDTKYVKIIEHLSTLNFVKERRAIATGCVYDIVVIDHGNQELSNVLEIINNKTSGRNVTTVPYNISYFDTLKDIIKRQQEKKEHYIWICSSVCDYTDFDFSYICDPYAKDQLHVFPSGMQKFGDTFFVDVNKARELINDMEKLEDFHKVNFNSTIKVKRLPEPVIVTTDDTQVAAIQNVTGFPYATLITEDNADIEDTLVEPMNLWSPESKNILITSTGGTRIVVPVEAKDHVTNELYEYPYIKRMPKLAKSKALDIVFVSNGELVAEQNYEHLSEFTRGLSNKIHRVDGINGRTEALHAAAEQSETPWFFCVPAKLFVNKKFDWNYQADRMQMPKHYIFNAHNPVNDLFYGHQSMVLYNKNLVLNNKGVGLDFTLDSPHMSVELNSGIVVGDTDAHSTWRTAFREAVKLKRYSDNGDETAQQRLDIWTSVGKGSYGAWSIEGALDGLEFYDEVNGELEKLRQSYYWDWLRDRFDSKY